MLKALLIADGRPDTNTEDLIFQDRLELVQKYCDCTAIYASFECINSFTCSVKNNTECFGGPVIDVWYRIEFQNMGSPH